MNCKKHSSQRLATLGRSKGSPPLLYFSQHLPITAARENTSLVVRGCLKSQTVSIPEIELFKGTQCVQM